MKTSGLCKWYPASFALLMLQTIVQAVPAALGSPSPEEETPETLALPLGIPRSPREVGQDQVLKKQGIGTETVDTSPLLKHLRLRPGALCCLCKDPTRAKHLPIVTSAVALGSHRAGRWRSG